ncbi:MAG: hypothetical protein ABIZ36_10555, partial [Gemmatimonadaceae bacterium]
QNSRQSSATSRQNVVLSNAVLHFAEDDMGGELLDPLKTTIVQNQRSMTTLVLANHNLVMAPV